MFQRFGRKTRIFLQLKQIFFVYVLFWSVLAKENKISELNMPCFISHFDVCLFDQVEKKKKKHGP